MYKNKSNIILIVFEIVDYLFMLDGSVKRTHIFCKIGSFFTLLACFNNSSTLKVYYFNGLL